MDEQELIDKYIDLVRNGKGASVREFTDNDFNAFIISGPQAGNNDARLYVGRVVQIRKEAGAWGSDIVFIRHYNEELWTHENQWFYYVSPEYLPLAEELFKDKLKDKPKTTYSINGKNKRKGFIIPSKIKEGESTPMRDIKNALYNKISDLIGAENSDETREEIKNRLKDL